MYFLSALKFAALSLTLTLVKRLENFYCPHVPDQFQEKLKEQKLPFKCKGVWIPQTIALMGIRVLEVDEKQWSGTDTNST